MSTKRGQPQSRRDYAEMVDTVVENYGCHVLDIGYFDVGGTPIRDEPPAGFLLEGDDPDEAGDYFADLVHVIKIRLVADNADSLAGNLIDCARALHDYLAAIRGGELDARKIMTVLRGGHVHVLTGMRESGHLEIKSSRYNIDASGHTAEKQKIEPAQDVARFANGDMDAILVLGFRELKSDRITEVGKLALLNLNNIDTAQYQTVLDSKIVPPITGLVIETVQIDHDSNSGIVFIFVPRQAEEMQPFLVHGSVVGDKVEGAFFSIVQRRGEASITLTASQIHGYIVAGKAFLRGTN